MAFTVLVACALVLVLSIQELLARPLKDTLTSRDEPDPSFAVSVQLSGVTFTNKGLVAFGLIPSNFTDSTGNTLGGIGSAIAVRKESFAKLENGSFTGTLVVQPDRGFNVDGTVDYQARQHEINFLLNAYYDADDLSFTDALDTLQLAYQSTLLYTERSRVATSGLDALAVRPQQSGFSSDALADPPMPIPATDYSHLSMDLEGLALNADGTFWASDEYGPYIYLMSGDGALVQTIQPPEAILPFHDGALNFTGSSDPTTGRQANQGFEGLTINTSGDVLYALLQSATIQDGGSDKSTSRYTRLLAYDISDAPDTRPDLIGEWVVPLPQSKKGNTRAASELHYVSDHVFLVLARDGDGHGGDDDKSSYKQADLVDISNATDIHGSKFDEPENPIASDGELDESITPGTYVGFVSFIDDTQLARFGLHNGKPADQTLIDAKWESLDLISCEDLDFPNDYFLFTASDNDFITEDGISLGISYDAGLNNDNQFMVYRLTLPPT